MCLVLALELVVAPVSVVEACNIYSHSPPHQSKAWHHALDPYLEGRESVQTVCVVQRTSHRKCLVAMVLAMELAMELAKVVSAQVSRNRPQDMHQSLRCKECRQLGSMVCLRSLVQSHHHNVPCL